MKKATAAISFLTVLCFLLAIGLPCQAEDNSLYICKNKKTDAPRLVKSPTLCKAKTEYLVTITSGTQGPQGPAGLGMPMNCSIDQIAVQTQTGWQCGWIENFSNATGICVQNTCNIISCLPPFGDCDNIVDNGCEANLTLDRNNCDSCGKSCPATQVCQNSQCTDCPTGWAVCNGNCVPLDFPDNCGSCGNVCQPGQMCLSGQCQCPPGWEYCSGNCVPIMGDLNNCGSCGNACHSGQMCSNGACITTPGFFP
jgi:hypothetical protein